MTKVVYASLRRSKAGRGPAGTSVPVKVVRAPDGTRIKISTVDSDSPTFSEDLTTAFRRNVARVRRENKRHVDTGRLASDG